jgi:pyruvate dehydrogenase E2 component (dihydrolipoamide acetyltransferase)
MTWKIGMPNLGHTMEEGTVSQWFKKVGDPVHKGEIIAAVESDKATFDLESPADGTLIAIEVTEGTMVPVGTTIGIVGELSEHSETADAEPQSAVEEAPVVEATPEVATAPAPAAAPSRRAGRVRITPAARVLAEELGVDPRHVVAADGDMINRDDVRAYMAERGPGAAQPLSPARRAIAEAMAHAWRTIPHVPLAAHADVSALTEHGTAHLTAAIARACALSLVEHTVFNGWLEDNAFRPSRSVNLGVAVATPEGLVNAVVSDAEKKSVAALRNEIGVLATSARTGRLDRTKTSGASFTLSALGRFGVDAFAPIISAPQVAILGVGKVLRVAREAAGGGVRFLSEVQLTLVFDHRANDGAGAAALLASIVDRLEHPQRLE